MDRIRTGKRPRWVEMLLFIIAQMGVNSVPGGLLSPFFMMTVASSGVTLLLNRRPEKRVITIRSWRGRKIACPVIL
jgi:hypothetical protein